MTAAREARMAERANRRDGRREQMFARLDTDGSGGLSEAEMAAGRDTMRERRGERGGEAHRGGRGGRGGHGRGMAMLRQADTNGDQIITRAEFDTSVEARFARVDTDSSGTITSAERDAARAAMRGERGERRGQRREMRQERSQ